jgi:Transposase DDE domain
VVNQARARGLLSDEHFTVDGTLIEAWAGHKSFKRKGDDQQTPPDDPGNPSVDFHGERRTNATHQSTTDPEARLTRKGPGKEARLCYAGHVQMDNRHGLVVNTRLTQASGTAEPEAALAMAAEIAGQQRVTLGADKGYDQKELVRALREQNVTPHVAQKSIAQSTAAPLANRAMPSVRPNANEWKRSSAGSRPSPDCERPGIGVPTGSVGCLPSRPPPTT